MSGREWSWVVLSGYEWSWVILSLIITFNSIVAV